MLVDASATESHLDPLTAAPERNRYLQTVVPFLRKLGGSATMSERTSYEPGMPSWVDLASPNPNASAAFYGSLFGWEVQSAGPVEETGGYGMFTAGRPGRRVSPIMKEGQPPAWTIYVATEDADADAAGVSEAGGDVLFGPMDVMDAGRMAVFAHPAAGVGVWQAGSHTGAALVNEPGR